jgi:hypothetical protein
MATICRNKLIGVPQINDLVIERNTKKVTKMTWDLGTHIRSIRQEFHPKSTGVGDCHLDENYLQDSIPPIKGSPVHEAPALRGVWEGVGPHWVIVGSLSLQILQEAVSMTWTRDLLATRQQLYHCAKAPLPIPPIKN